MKETLIRKGSKFVSRYMRSIGYMKVCDYEEGENTVVDFSMVHAGVTLKRVSVVFSKKWRVIDVR